MGCYCSGVLMNTMFQKVREFNDDSAKPSIKNMKTTADKRCLEIFWSDGVTSRYPHVLLRDSCNSCKCPQCSVHQTVVNAIVEFGVDISLKKSTVSDDGKTLSCLWPDGHESEYSSEFLLRMRMPESRIKRGENVDDLVKDELVLWNRETMQNAIPSYDYNDIMNDHRCLFDSLYDLYQRGMIMLNNAPQRDGVVLEMVAKIGWGRKTNFGDCWNAKVVDNPTNISYTNNALYFHTDISNVCSPPSIAALHCIDQPDQERGGKSLYVDGFNVVKQLKQTCPEAFDLLKNVEVKFADEGANVTGEYSISYSNPIIKTNKHGRITDFIVSNMLMSEIDKYTTVDQLLQFHDAYHELMKILYAPENTVDYHMRPGQIAVIQNTRVLHGRTALDTTAGPLKRWIQVTYMDWDAVFSKLRVLQRKLGLKSPYLHEVSNDFF
ncbi:gamma-butyrobetaine dioxygenase-like isoform X3 [Dendronephthya gigantea]|uniref:gamma-butyrobetaine dioxygenase-like isoform X3 n=1 Tax=Dendronephthya gigantea TaxID=151771 RepID=UPI00106B6760|nr:gamma-butyrobetaine dioxygenase-like isoform X3 [Dendronephthya gigantea]